MYEVGDVAKARMSGRKIQLTTISKLRMVRKVGTLQSV